MASVDKTAPVSTIAPVSQSLSDDSTPGFHFWNLSFPVTPNVGGADSTKHTKCVIKKVLQEILGARVSRNDVFDIEKVTVRFNFCGADQWINCAIVKANYTGKTRTAGMMFGFSVASNQIDSGKMQIIDVLPSGGVSTRVYPTPSNLAAPMLMFSASAGVNAVVTIRWKVHGETMEFVQFADLPLK
jgi:hypothetical protein